VAEGCDTGERSARVVVDPQLRLPGRGAWLHPTPECFDLAVRRKAFGRALRVRVFLEVAAVGTYIDAHVQSSVNAVGSTLEQAVQQVPELKAGLKLMSTR
jgi:predicted RNA-binding protein YlxR (DUF448 family)